MISTAVFFVVFLTTLQSVLSAPVPFESFKVKRSYSGQATYFDVGLGACGDTSVSTDYIVALGAGTYGSGEYCDKTLVITDASSGTSATATVKDKCMSCADGDLDLSQSLFEVFYNTDVGVFDITWEWSDSTTTTTEAAAEDDSASDTTTDSALEASVDAESSSAADDGFPPTSVHSNRPIVPTSGFDGNGHQNFKLPGGA